MALSFSRRVVYSKQHYATCGDKNQDNVCGHGNAVAYSVLVSKTDANRSGSIKSSQASSFWNVVPPFAMRAYQHGPAEVPRWRPPTIRPFSRDISFSHHGHFHLGHMPSNE